MLISAISFDTQEVRDKFTEFYELYAVELIYFASNLIKDTSLAQDIVHDTLIHYIESQDELGCFTSDRTRALLFTCVRNRAYNMCKHRKYEIQEGDKLDTYETPALTVLDRLIKEENISFLYKELFRLDPDLQTLLQLKYYYKLSSKRIAKLTGSKPQAVDTKLCRVRKKLKVLLEKKGVSL